MLRYTSKLRLLKSTPFPTLLQASSFPSQFTSQKGLYYQQVRNHMNKNSPGHRHHHNPHHDHDHDEHGNCIDNKPLQRYTGPFEEKSFMNYFLSLSHHRIGHSNEVLIDMFKTLRANLDNFTKPNSMVALLHKLQFFDEYIDANLRNKILSHTHKVFLNNYQVNSDNGDMLRAVVLVVCLQKINDPGFYKDFFGILLKNIDSMSFFNLLTATESYTYNKWLFRVASHEEVLTVLSNLSAKLQVREFMNFAKYTNLLYYIVKNAQYKNMTPQQAEELKGQINKLVNHLYDVILQLIINDRNLKTLDLFALTDVFLSLDSFNYAFPKLKEKYSLFRKYYNSIIDSYLPKNFELSNVKYNLATIISFLKRYYVVPPTNIHPQFGKFLNKVFLKHYKDPEFRSLDTYVYFLLFLGKVNQLEIPENVREDINLQEMIVQERNLFVLSKTLEFFALSEQSNQNFFSADKKELQTLEKVIFQIIGRLNKKGLVVSPALLQVFQLIVALNMGSGEDWKNLLEIFSNKEALKRLDHMELIIKLVPAGGVKTKGLYKVYSNTAGSEAAYYLKGVQLDDELTGLLEKFWNTIEEILVERANDIYPDKFPILLFHFVYANVFKNSYKRLYKIAESKLLHNLNALDAKQLSDVVYAYSRVNEKSDLLFFQIAKKILDEKLYNRMSITEIVNLYWGFANAGLWVEELSKACEAKMLKDLKSHTLETFTQFCQAIAINNRQLEPSDLKALGSRAVEFLKDLSKPKKIFNIQHILGILNSFSIMGNYHDREFWHEAVSFLCLKKDLYQDNALLFQYVYKLYIHLVMERADVKKHELFDIIQKDYRSLVTYLKTHKKTNYSIFENRVKSIVRENLKDIFGPDAKVNEGDEILFLHRGPEHDLLLVNDLSQLDSLIQAKKLQGLGARELLVPYTGDIIVDNYVIEVNGPSHYLKDELNELKENGFNALKRNLFERAGMKYIEIPYTVNDDSNPNNEHRLRDYLKERVKEFA